MENVSVACEPLSVSALSYALKSVVESQFGQVYIRGEVSGAKLHASGHLYFALKDDQSVLDGVCWRGTLSKSDLIPQDGMEVLCWGRLTTYPGRSKYQLVVEKITLSGEGTLLKLLEERRRKLAAEGLFDEARKKRLPLLPQCIGIITSPTGAVIADMLHRLNDRCPRHVILWGASVQGERAVPDIVAAIEGFNHGSFPSPRPDVIIVARGGGSLEDLWAFNDEAIVRAVAASHIPIISGVGHEPDVTLIDYVSDWRAPTPSAAAERVVPVRSELLDALGGQQSRLLRALLRLNQETEQKLDERIRRLESVGALFLERVFSKLTHLTVRLRSPQDTITQKTLALETWGLRSVQALQQTYHLTKARYEALSGLLESYSYAGTLARGFALIKNASGAYIKSARDAKAGVQVHISFHDGDRQALIGGTAKKVKEESLTRQPTLFS